MTFHAQMRQRYFAVSLGLTAVMATSALGAPTHREKNQEKLKPMHAIALNGQVSGTCGQRGGEINRRSDFPLSGRGDVSPLGAVTATVTMDVPHGDIAGHSRGVMTLTGTHGTVTVALSSAQLFAFTGKPIPATFRVTSGTSSYAGATGAGDAEITLSPEYRPQHIPGRPTPMFVRASMFKITLHGKTDK